MDFVIKWEKTKNNQIQYAIYMLYRFRKLAKMIYERQKFSIR